jgi:hypothetical protein
MFNKITLLCLAQAVAVFTGFVGLAIYLRLNGYPQDPSGFASFGSLHWSRVTLFSRRYGLVLMIVPFYWIVCTLVAERRCKYILPFGIWLSIGMLLPFALLAPFLYSICSPCVFVQ